MDLDQLHPDLQPVYQKVPRVPFHAWWFRNLMPLAQAVRKRLTKPRPVAGVRSQETTLGGVGVKLYQPEQAQPRGLVLWLHGGGYILGDASINDDDCQRLVTGCGVAVVSVDYRLAPKHPFPAALQDVMSVWHWLVGNATSLGVSADCMVLAGQSAGAGLAAAVVQKIADDGGQQPLAQVLIYPMLDDRTAANTNLDAANHRLWSNVNNRAAWQMYLGQPPGAAQLPDYAAPGRRADLHGLPPAWIGCGSVDLFYPENQRYYQQLQAAGVPVEFYQVAGAPHGFDGLAPELALVEQFRGAYSDFIDQVLA